LWCSRLTLVQLERAKDLEGVHAEKDLNKAAQLAVDLAKEEAGEKTALPSQPVHVSSPVVFSSEGQYESTRENLNLKQGAKVLVMGAGKAVSRGCPVMMILRAVLIPQQHRSEVWDKYHRGLCSEEGGDDVLGPPSIWQSGEGEDLPLEDDYDAEYQAVSALQPQVVSVFVPFTAAADAIIECIETEIPLVVSYAEGIPQRDQLRVSSRYPTGQEGSADSPRFKQRFAASQRQG